MKFLFAEFAFFRGQNRHVRTLLITMFIYFLTSPLQNTFSCAYILRQTHSVKTMMWFLLALYSAVPVTSWIVGRWMNRWGAERMLAFGLALTGVSMFTLSLVSLSSILAVSLVGAAIGVAIAFVWASHNYLVFVSTTDESRNYFQSLEQSCLTFCSMLSSFAIGWFVSRVWTPEISYLIVKGIALLLTVASAMIIMRDRFPIPQKPAFVFFRYTPLAWKLFGFAFLRGFTQLFAIMVPVLLVFCVLRQNEFLLGKVQSIGALVAGLLLYIVGRVSAPRHRIWLYITSAVTYALGACVNAVLNTAMSSLVFIMILLFFGPLMDMSYTTLFLQAADKIAEEEKRNSYTYIFAQECFFYLGRLVTMGMIFGALYFSEEKIITIAFPILTLFHLFSIPIAWSLSKMEFSEQS
jgi:MFS transporter, YQGE family, putative transporter